VAATTDFLVTASCDVDADGVFAHYSATATTQATIPAADTQVY
jgi:hypothetical protein